MEGQVMSSEIWINVLLALMIIVSFLISIVLHECAHIVMAYWLGDRTPIDEGRFTFRLSEHIDPVGLLMCIVLAFQPITGALPVGLGWGKPVKPDPWRMRTGPNSGLLIVALAGPIFSLLLGLLVGFLTNFTVPYLTTSSFFTAHLLQFLIVFACTNVALALFNLIPLYPLDGYQIVYALLPNRQAGQFAKSAAYGQFIILGIFFFLPFLAQLARISNPLFEPAYYIWLGAAHLVGLTIPGLLGGFPLVFSLYTL